MTLPEIPHEAVVATRGAPGHSDDVVSVLLAAWPHLYAAALRHAAETIDVPSEIVSDEGRVDWANWRARRTDADKLRRTADEATA